MTITVYQQEYDRQQAADQRERDAKLLAEKKKLMESGKIAMWLNGKPVAYVKAPDGSLRDPLLGTKCNTRPEPPPHCKRCPSRDVKAWGELCPPCISDLAARTLKAGKAKSGEALTPEDIGQDAVDQTEKLSQAVDSMQLGLENLLAEASQTSPKGQVSIKNDIDEPVDAWLALRLRPVRFDPIKVPAELAQKYKALAGEVQSLRAKFVADPDSYNRTLFQWCLDTRRIKMIF